METNFSKLRVRGAAPAIKKALLLDEEILVTHEAKDGIKRRLIHGITLRAIKPLPWPLSLVQPREVKFTVENSSGQIITTRIFKRSEIDDAIRTFMKGLSPDDEVRILIN